MLIKDIKKVAEYLWQGVPNKVYEYAGEICVETKLGTFDFMPQEDGCDTMQVFKALVDECKDQKIILIDSVIGKKLEFGPLYIETGNGKLNENICLAYLAVMESK